MYLLLLFTPLAFGGVEDWALGVLQILTGIVVAAWAWGERETAPGAGSGERADAAGPSRWPLFVPIALFTLLVLFQLVPLPRGAIRTLAPSTDALYTRTVPGYAEGKPFDPDEIGAWLEANEADAIPPGFREPEGAAPLPAPSDAFAPRASERRTLSIYPLLTREKLTVFLCFAALFAVVLYHFRSRRRLTRLLDMAVFAGFAVSFLGIVQKISWNGKLYWIREGEYLNVFGPFVNRNNYAAFAGLVLPLAVCTALGALRQVRSGERAALPRLVFNGFAAVIIGGGICYSLSRGGMLAAGLAAAIVAAFLVYYGRNRLEMGLLAGFLVVVIGFLIWIGPEAVVERVGTISEGSSTPSLALRFQTWKRVAGMISENAILGTGLGTFRFSFLRYAPPGRSWWTQAHNEYLELICDTGLAGGVLLLAGVLLYLSKVPAPGVFRDTRGRDRYVYAGLVAGIVSLLVHSAVSSNIQIPANGLLLVVLAAALLNLSPRSASRQSRRSSRPRSAAGTGASP